MNFPALALNNKTIVVVIAVLLTLVGLNVFRPPMLELLSLSPIREA